jgi:hypothetical protein
VAGACHAAKLGDLTYPLYLCHEVVLFVILTVTTGYAYSTLAVGFVLGFVIAAILMALIDPAVTLYRDRIRGRALRQAQSERRRAGNRLAASTLGTSGQTRNWTPIGVVTLNPERNTVRAATSESLLSGSRSGPPCRCPTK